MSDHGWKCCGCGHPGEYEACPCATVSIYRRVNGKQELGVKIMKPMLVDSKCRELAEHFLADVPGFTPEQLTDLAETLQMTCEDACREIEHVQKTSHK